MGFVQRQSGKWTRLLQRWKCHFCPRMSLIRLQEAAFLPRSYPCTRNVVPWISHCHLDLFEFSLWVPNYLNKRPLICYMYYCTFHRQNLTAFESRNTNESQLRKWEKTYFRSQFDPRSVTYLSFYVIVIGCEIELLTYFCQADWSSLSTINYGLNTLPPWPGAIIKDLDFVHFFFEVNELLECLSTRTLDQD